MLKNSLIILMLLMAFSFTSCFGLFDSRSERITGKYILLWIDMQENQSIVKEMDSSGGGENLIQEYVFAVGHNESFIIAKQHPTYGFDSGYEINDSITNYFIIEVNNDINEFDNNIYGPLSKDEFDSLRLTMKITNIEFDMIYPDKY